MKSVVSVILTVYNTEKYLEQCLDSLLSQSLKDIEIICVDDASTDQSVDIIRYYQRLDNRIQLIQLSKNKGANFARNMALKKVQGKYVAILDGDDFFEPTFLEKLYTQAEKTHADITFCGFNTFDDQERKINTILWDINRKILPKNDLFFMTPKLFNILPSFVWNQLYRRYFIQKNHLSFANVASFTDVYFNKTALLQAERISYVDEKLIYYRINNKDSISHNLRVLDGVRTIYSLAEFLNKKGFLERYKSAFFECSLNKMNRLQNLPEPYQSLLRSFYQKDLIPKFWGSKDIPLSYPEVGKIDTCSDTFKDFFFNKRDHILPIVFSSNEKNIPLTAVAIQSIQKMANPDYFYDIYILHTDLSPTTCFNLALLSQGNLRLTPFNVTRQKNNYMDFTKYPFLIPSLFKGYDKVLYLGNNTLVQNDLSELFKISIGKYEVAGISTHLTKKEQKQYKKLHLKPDTCIGSDVVLFNIPLAKESDLTERLKVNNKRFLALKPTFLQIINITASYQKLDKTDILIYDFNPQKKLSDSISKKWLKVARSSLFYEWIVRNWM